MRPKSWPGLPMIQQLEMGSISNVQAKSSTFSSNARQALSNVNLQNALKRLHTGFVTSRTLAVARMPEFELLRDHARDIKDHVLAHLDVYLEKFESRCQASGGHVHWCRDAKNANETILNICQNANAKTVTKGKSMIGEEIAINDYLEDHQIEPIETDLGEYIIQLRKEAPSHIIAPATHVSKNQVAEAFLEAHTNLDPARTLDEPDDILAEARKMLRNRYLEADVGITGANFLVAETGTSIIVTNEGNGDLTQTLPQIHIVLASIEKVVPTLIDATALLRVLARSATGQELSSYTTFSTGPKRATDADGPEEYHVILLDNGRSDLLNTEFKEILRCIKCGACLNHCPVYSAIGGHAYGWVYPGPMGSVLSPGLIGLETTSHLPQASTLCGKCEEVCPVRIPLPRLLRNWRFKIYDQGLLGRKFSLGLAIWAFLAKRPKLYQFIVRWLILLLSLGANKQKLYKILPGLNTWTQSRDFPVPQGKTFMRQWRDQGNE